MKTRVRERKREREKEGGVETRVREWEGEGGGKHVLERGIGGREGGVETPVSGPAGCTLRLILCIITNVISRYDSINASP